MNPNGIGRLCYESEWISRSRDGRSEIYRGILSRTAGRGPSGRGALTTADAAWHVALKAQGGLLPAAGIGFRCQG